MIIRGNESLLVQGITGKQGTFWSEKMRESLYAYDGERLREFFQLPRVLDGLFSLVGRLYDVDVRRVAAGAVPVWDPAVEFFEVVSAGEVIAGFYVDP